MQNTNIAFLTIGIAFIVLGITGQRAFLYIGIVFLVIALLRWRRARS